MSKCCKFTFLALIAIVFCFGLTPIFINTSVHKINIQYKEFATRQLKYHEPHNRKFYKYNYEINYSPKKHKIILRKYANKYLNKYLSSNDYSEQRGYIAKDLTCGFLIASVCYMSILILYSSLFYLIYKDRIILRYFIFHILKAIATQSAVLVTICSLIVSFSNFMTINSFEQYGIKLTLGIISFTYISLIIKIIASEYLYKVHDE